MDIILIAGLWLPHSIWSDVSNELHRLGHRAVSVALPGVDDGSPTATLDDQVAAVVSAVDDADQPVVVGHSAACTLAWLAADRRPESVRQVVLVGGFPASDGDAYADFFQTKDGVMAFPGWEPFEGPDAADLGEEDRERISAITIAVPEGVSKGVVRLGDEQRYNVPVSLVCPEYSPAQAREWIEGGEVPELARAKQLDYVDIDSGHWPMVSKPVELSGLVHALAG